MNKAAIFLTCTLVIVFAAFCGLVLALLQRISRLRGEARSLRAGTSQQQQGVHHLQLELADIQARLHRTESQLTDAQEALKKRPVYRRANYRIATVGARGCGKTELTFRCWANPIFKGKLEQTQFARYNKTVSRQVSQAVVDHMFEILDWGGELINEAQATLVKQDIHAMLMVVDLGHPDGNEYSEERVKEQLAQFNKHVMYFFFSPEIIKHCQTFVLFINKTDLLNGFPQEIEKQARSLYQPLIDILMKYGEDKGVSINVFIGSAATGAGTGKLFAHLIERILRPEDYDEELSATLESIKQEGPAPQPPKPHRAAAPPPAPMPALGRHAPIAV